MNFEECTVVQETHNQDMEHFHKPKKFPCVSLQSKFQIIRYLSSIAPDNNGSILCIGRELCFIIQMKSLEETQ